MCEQWLINGKAGKDVSENFNVLEELFTTCDKSISAISMMVEGVRELAPELQEIVIEVSSQC